ncbi:thioredoxin family protein [Magnetococcus sp. PR-3]|uniref:thioredoxin family protein n=1 Tax=Magnetococcus sp. PR-3 TaxID=3120355 RepID=UPI002FCE4FF4
MPRPQAILLMGPGCPHCSTMLTALSELLETGELAKLEVFNVQRFPEEAATRGVRSVPWLSLGPFVFTGALTLAELRHWLAQRREPKGMALYFDHLFSSGQRQLVETIVRNQPKHLSAFVDLLGDDKVGINTRLGVGVVLEELQGSGISQVLTEGLCKLTEHKDPRIRGDACHYLPLTGDRTAIPYLEARLDDDNGDVREIAREALDELDDQSGGSLTVH